MQDERIFALPWLSLFLFPPFVVISVLAMQTATRALNVKGGKTAKMVHSQKVKGYRRSGRKEAAPSTHFRAHRALEAGNNTHGGRPGWLCPMDTRTCSLRLLQTRLDPQTYRVYDKDLRTKPKRTCFSNISKKHLCHTRATQDPKPEIPARTCQGSSHSAVWSLA